ncbi:MAG TPA: hypothetical protein VE035_14040 [Puia sp.]|nr:hypothetical protein [Puia sp.]
MRLNSRLTLPFFVFFSLLLTLVVYWWGYDKPTYGIDDANIYFVYMRHLAQGHGFVWNIGSERVEGFTSLLWTLVGAAFYRLSGENFVWLLFGISFILTWFTLVRLLFFLRRCNNTMDRLLTDTDIIMMALLLFPLGFLEWNIMGLMETGLWLFLIVNLTLELCNACLLDKRPNLFYFSALLAVMIPTRPESIAYGMLFICLLFIQQLTGNGLRTALRRVSLPFLTYIATLTAVIGWRIRYFGYPFPNTYYAKVSGNTMDNIKRGLSYLHKFFYEYPQAAFTIAIGVFFAAILLYKWRQQGKRIQWSGNDNAQALLLLVIFCALALPVLTGGDHFKFSRFYQCIMPLTYASVLNYTFWNRHIGQFNIGNARNRLLLAAAISFGIFFIAKSTWYDFTTVEKYTATRVSPEFFHARNGRTIADKENETFDACSHYPSVGILAAGGFAYDYKGNTIDLMGLNSTQMAHATRIKHGFRNHASFDVNTFWKLMPDMVGTFYGGEIVTDTTKFILAENTDYFRNGTFVYFAYKQLFDYPRFIADYLPALVRKTPNDFYIFAYYNKAFLNTLDSRQFQVILLERKLAPKKIGDIVYPI